jgi:hypothetical protein
MITQLHRWLTAALSSVLGNILYHGCTIEVRSVYRRRRITHSSCTREIVKPRVHCRTERCLATIGYYWSRTIGGCLVLGFEYDWCWHHGRYGRWSIAPVSNQNQRHLFQQHCVGYMSVERGREHHRHLLWKLLQLPKSPRGQLHPWQGASG